MKWTQLTDVSQLEAIKKDPNPSIIFKHSTRCSVSLMAKRKFESEWSVFPEHTPLYFLDLIAHRNISNQIAEDFQVFHESPQILVISSGACVYDASHGEIDATEVVDFIKK